MRLVHRPILPGEVVHKMSSSLGFAVCGATEREGARFTNMLRRVTCASCRRLISERRAKAVAEFERTGP